LGQIAGMEVGQGKEKMKIVPKKVFGDVGERWPGKKQKEHKKIVVSREK
jgi:hypothetical protein